MYRILVHINLTYCLLIYLKIFYPTLIPNYSLYRKVNEFIKIRKNKYFTFCLLYKDQV